MLTIPHEQTKNQKKGHPNINALEKTEAARKKKLLSNGTVQ
jgi:hypothetical protein